MLVSSVGIWGAEDYVALAVIGNCEILVATACSDRESCGVVSIELGEWYVRDVKLVGKGKLGGLAAWFEVW
jgi:hypothetical protein